MSPADPKAAARPDAEPAGPESAGSGPGAPARSPARARVTPLAEGPLLVEGPVEIVLPDGTVRRSDRPVVALCRCRRSLRDPFCDTSHRRRSRAARRTDSSDSSDNSHSSDSSDDSDSSDSEETTP
ncbi:CDGSH iron-sulfur domain-containing protein [Streptomyces filamentosus]|uniref:Iron-binding zinc finger CDGSH type domain-containing protein n=1 Tax=Streptomyces filamentosus TaxID=67294 RepID=A0A919BXQ3_STRFL|nr:hypothetical protein GCM10017667_78950 [Streptomyces filamentosus]